MTRAIAVGAERAGQEWRMLSTSAATSGAWGRISWDRPQNLARSEAEGGA